MTVEEPDPDERRQLYTMFSRRPLATYGLLGVCVLIWVLTVRQAFFMTLDGHFQAALGTVFGMPTGEQAVAFGAQENSTMVAHHEYWRLLSAAFVHFGIVHLLVNGLALWQVGSFQERFFGTGRFLFIYLGAALTGNLATWWLLPAGMPSAGASGAIFGLLGAQWALELLKTLPAPLRRSWTKGALPWILGNLAFGFGVNRYYGDTGDIALNNYADVGGLLGGAALCWLVRGRGGAERDPVAVLGYMFAMIALACCGIGIYQGIRLDPQFILFGH